MAWVFVARECHLNRSPAHCNPYHHVVEEDWYKFLFQLLLLLHMSHCTPNPSIRCICHQLLKHENRKNLFFKRGTLNTVRWKTKIGTLELLHLKDMRHCSVYIVPECNQGTGSCNLFILQECLCVTPHHFHQNVKRSKRERERGSIFSYFEILS